ncbi:MAG: hypothetical protein SGJ19_24135 [Planctomycetia bacterium]|nr:hypothetical protein [Planctomycetia bacterium]
MSFQLFHVRSFALVLGLLVAVGARFAAAESELVAAFPAGAVVYGELSDAGAVAERLHGSAYWSTLVDSPQWKQAQGTPQWRQFAAGRTLVERQLGMDAWEAAKSLLGHRVAVALYPRGPGEKPNVVALVRTADAGFLPQLREQLAPMLALAEEKLHVSQALDGVERINLDNHGFLAWKGDWLVFADKEQLLDQSLSLLAKNEGESLKQDQPYQAMLAQAKWDAPPSDSNTRLLRVYANMAMINQAAGGRFVPEKLDNALSSLVLGESLQLASRSPYLSVAVDVGDHGWLATATTAGDRAELGELYAPFFPPAGEAGVKPFPEVPKLLGGVTIYRDFAKWYGLREQLLQEQLMPEFDKFESGLANLLPGKDFGEDVLPLVGRRLTFVAAPQDFAHLDGEPAVKLPGFALVVELAKPDEAAAILQFFTQTLAAILNIEAGQQGRQPWVMTSEAYQGVQIAYADYLDKPTGDKLGIAFNFLPATARVGDQYILSSSRGLCRQLVDALQQPATSIGAHEAPRTIDTSLQVGPITDLLEENREFFQGRMIQEGRTAEEAKAEFDVLITLLRRLVSLRLSTVAEAKTFQLQFAGSWQ